MHRRRSSAVSGGSPRKVRDRVIELRGVNSTKEAIARIQALQKGNCSSGPGSGSGSGGQPRQRQEYPHVQQYTRGVHSSNEDARSKAPQLPSQSPAAAELPVTLGDFYASPNCVVSMGVARRALFDDALSGFHSLANREEAEAAAIKKRRTEAAAAEKNKWQQQQQLRTSSALSSTTTSRSQPREGEQPAAAVVSARAAGAYLPAPSSSSSQRQAAATPPRDAAAGKGTSVPVAAAAAAQSKPTHAGPATAFGARPHKPPPEPNPQPAKADETRKQEPEKEDAEEEETVSASLMFLWRSRDEAALTAMQSPLPCGVRSGAEPSALEIAFDSGMSSRKPSGIHWEDDDAAEAGTGAFIVAAGGDNEQQGSSVSPAMTPTKTAAAEETLRQQQYIKFLQNKALARSRAPAVFRFAYPPVVDFVRDGGDRLTDRRERQLSMKLARGNPANAIAAEWLYVWEQFERDIHREVLLIEDRSYNTPATAIEAIHRYVEESYDRGRAALLEPKNKKTAGASSAPASAKTTPATEPLGATRGSSAATPPTAAAGASGTTTTTAPPPEKKSFLGEFFSNALRDVAMRAHDALPAFMADPLVAASGLDPSAVRVGAIYPADPQARGTRVYAAVREVVLAAQQSFMGFPYHLLCEQVGTERLALALEEYLEEEQELHRQQREVHRLSIAAAEGKREEEEAAAATATAIAAAQDMMGNGRIGSGIDSNKNAGTEADSLVSLASGGGGFFVLPLAATTPIPLNRNVTTAECDTGSPISSFPQSPFLGRGSPVRGSLGRPWQNSYTSSNNAGGGGIVGSSSLRFHNSSSSIISSTPASPLMPPASPSSSHRVLRIYHGGPDKVKTRPPSTSASPFEEATAAAASDEEGDGKKDKSASGRTNGAGNEKKPTAAAVAAVGRVKQAEARPASQNRQQQRRHPHLHMELSLLRSTAAATTTTGPTTATKVGELEGKEAQAAAELRRLEVKRRERERRLPLLVGEPRPAEFQALLAIVMATVERKNRRDERRRQRSARQLEEQRRHQRPVAHGGGGTSPLTSELPSMSMPSLAMSGRGRPLTSPLRGVSVSNASLGSASWVNLDHSATPESPATATPEDATAAASTTKGESGRRHRNRRNGLFRSDVDGSAYLLPVNLPAEPENRFPVSSARSSTTTNPSVSASTCVSVNHTIAPGDGSASDGPATPPQQPPALGQVHGMRVHLYYDPARNAPVVCVNKVFRLFTVPGLRSFKAAVGANQAAAAATAPNDGSPSFPDSASSAEGADEKCLLLLIQIEFTLFTQDEAEVRWRWYSV